MSSASVSDIPELIDYLVPHFFYNAGGAGGTCPFTCGIVADSEDGLLGSYAYSVLIHEFTHVLHGALNRADPEFDNRLRTTYNAAMAKGLWTDTYAASNRGEYLAEAVGSWFHTAESNNPIKTRDALKAYDPSLGLLITEIFGDYAWRYTPLAMRTHLPHLQGFDPRSAPKFTYPPGVLEAYEELYSPAINEREEWVNLPPYDPSLIPILNKSRTSGERTDIFLANISGTTLSLYWVRPDGTEHLAYRFHSQRRVRQFTAEVGGLLLVKDAIGSPLAVFQAVEKAGRALVGPALNLITPGLSKISGDNQAGVPGALLANPFVIELRDENGSALEGISVTFTVTTGGGTLNTTHTTTDENGRAKSTLTLGTNLGTNTVSVSATGIGETVAFNVVADAAVDIPDANLRAAIETARGKAPGESITGADMAMLPKLDARNTSISDLTGLEHATNLESLWLDGEDVQGIWRNSNSVSNLSPLAGLTNLIELELRDNNITDLSPLADLTSLTRLGLRDNNISDLSPLAGLTNLTWLGLWGNRISDLSPLTRLTKLTELRLGGNKITDISPVAGFINLETLLLRGNNISDISAISGLTNLTRLGLAHNNISDLSPLARLTNLATLGLHGNRISDLSPLAGLTNLAKVVLRRNPLSYQSIHTHIPDLQSRGVTVYFDNQSHPALLKISGDNQKGAAFAPLSQPFVIEAQDANGSVLVGVSMRFAVTAGGGTLNTTITRTDANGRAQSTLTLGPNLGTNTVEVSAAGIEVPATFHAISDTESPPIIADVNSDGSVNILDLIVVASELGNTGTNLMVDVNRDGIVSILDLILVAGMFDGAAAAPAASSQVSETLTAVEVQDWLTDARALEIGNPIMKRGFLVLEQLLISLTPKETELLSNYPNPFNPETWIPYRLAEDAFITLTIYDEAGRVVRTLDVGHRIAAVYESQSKAIYWDGRNDVGEGVASGVYFYTLTAGDYSATQKMVILK